MMTASEYALHRFCSWGYTESEARFLCLVATHSGYFFLKHYADFIGCASNKRTAKFIKRALKKGHIQARPYEHRNSKLYHLCARRVYAQLEQEDSSFRKVRKAGSVTLARTRLLVTSFIVGHPDQTYLETEANKLAYFAQLGVGTERLPFKRYRNNKKRKLCVRYFPDKFPIFIAGNTEWKQQIGFEADRETKRELKLYCQFKKQSLGEVIVSALQYLFAADAEFGPWLEGHQKPASENSAAETKPEVFFTYFDEGTSGMKEFAAWLNRYQMVFEALRGAYHVLYISGTEQHFRKAERLFRNALSPERSRETIQEYFRLRELWENKRFSTFTDNKLWKLNKYKKRFNDPGFEHLFADWKLAVSPEEKAAVISVAPMGNLSTLVLLGESDAPRITNAFGRIKNPPCGGARFTPEMTCFEQVAIV